MSAVTYINSTDVRKEFSSTLDNVIHSKPQFIQRTHNHMVFIEEGESAKTTNRTQLQLLLKYITNNRGSIGYLIIYDISRISRDVGDFAHICKILAKNGVELVSATEPSIDHTPVGKLSGNLTACFAQYENDQKIVKVKSAMRQRASQGYWVTQAPLGFEVKTLMPDGSQRDSVRGERKKYPKILVPDNRNNLAKNLTKVMIRFSNGDITEAEAHTMALKLGITGAHGAPLTFSRFDAIMRSPVYAGYNNSQKLLDGEMVKLKFDGLISLDVWQRNQTLLNRNKRELKARNSNLYPLDGTILCEHCGMPLHGDAPRDGSKNQVARYYCRGGIKRGHGYESAKASEIHELFDDFLQQTTPTEGTIRLFKEVLKRVAAKKLGSANAKLSELAKEDSRLSDRKKSILDLLVDGKLSVDEKNEMITDIEEKRERLRLRRKELEDQQELNELTIEYVCNFMDKPVKLWRDANLESKRALQKLMFPNGLHIDLKAKKCRTEDLSPLYSVVNAKKEPKGSENSNMVISARVELALTG